MRIRKFINTKKIMFLGVSVLLVATSFYLAINCAKRDGDQFTSELGKYVLFLALISITSALIVQYLEGGKRGVRQSLFVGTTPFFLCLGVFFFYLYYPNLSFPVKLMAGVFNVFLLYTLLLLNNVLLVVGNREEVIPVYRVAISWVQIVLLGVSISLFTGIHRVLIQPVMQTLVVAGVSLILYLYAMWAYFLEREIRRPKTKESLTLAISLVLLTGWASFMTLFFSAETFLRGLFISSVFLLGLGYIQLYVKNSLSKRSLLDYIAPALFFFVVMAIFKP